MQGPASGWVYLFLALCIFIYQVFLLCTDLQNAPTNTHTQSSLWCCHRVCVCVWEDSGQSGWQAGQTNQLVLTFRWTVRPWYTQHTLVRFWEQQGLIAPLLWTEHGPYFIFISFLDDQSHSMWLCCVHGTGRLLSVLHVCLNSKHQVVLSVLWCVCVYKTVLCSESRVHDAIGMLRDLPGALGGNCALLLLSLGRVCDGLGVEKKTKHKNEWNTTKYD